MGNFESGGPRQEIKTSEFSEKQREIIGRLQEYASQVEDKEAFPVFMEEEIQKTLDRTKGNFNALITEFNQGKDGVVDTKKKGVFKHLIVESRITFDTKKITNPSKEYPDKFFETFAVYYDQDTDKLFLIP